MDKTETGKSMPYYLPSLLDTKKVAPMTREETELFLKCTLAEMNGYEKFTEDVSKEMGFSGQVLFKRLSFYDSEIEISVPAAIVTTIMAKGSPGNLVMYAFTFTRLYKVDNKPITISVLANVFPVGFPTEEGLLEIWDAQKGNEWGENKVDNLLDNPQLLSDTAKETDKKEWVRWLKS